MFNPRELISAVKKLEIKTRKNVDELTGGAYHSVFKGRGMEFCDVREYSPGDDVRTIDWNVTARAGHPYVKQFTEERELTINILVDISASADFGGNKTRMQNAIEIAMLIAFSAIRNRDRVGLMLHSDEEELHLRAKRGKQHILRLARELIVHQRKRARTNIKQLLDRFMQSQKKKSVVFLISDLMDPKDFQKSLRAVGKKHDLIVINILDEFEINIPKRLPPLLMQDAETGLLDFFKPNAKIHAAAEKFIERNKKACVEAGADWMLLKNTSDPTTELMKFFGRRNQRR
ncbi:hypothetical protein LNTAR_03314 [Lentisphaera araneosa HTCC2155]|uniref:DUF58 domain-containing protein n=1 Tax=Lentisphaera araneosa HTCC2155 TaxID=313628 RepID=A6DT50_9BACT|nr:DUF58 domain-containing protein [Lentisphaera araneosa]EDM25225.1 hypothetical protein LNTAR_03314 [Lentisphaera araneosa HTCC2155]